MKTEIGEIIRQKRIEKDLTQVELEHKQRVDELFKKTGLFFAFSDEQFEKNKTGWRYGVGLPCRLFQPTTAFNGKLHYTACCVSGAVKLGEC